MEITWPWVWLKTLLRVQKNYVLSYMLIMWVRRLSSTKILSFNWINQAGLSLKRGIKFREIVKYLAKNLKILVDGGKMKGWLCDILYGYRNVTRPSWLFSEENQITLVVVAVLETMLICVLLLAILSTMVFFTVGKRVELKLGKMIMMKV